MTGDEERDSLAQELRRLSLDELLDVLRRVLPAHANRDDDLVPSVLTLAEVSTSVDVDPVAEPPYIEVVAWPDHDHYDGRPGSSTLTQQGTCPRCGLDVISTVKRAFCSFCEATCHLT